MYTKHKEWPLDGVEIKLSHSCEYEVDGETVEEDGHLMDVIRRSITLHGPSYQEQKERLAYIATRYPVHKTLTNSPQIVDEIAIAK